MLNAHTKIYTHWKHTQKSSKSNHISLETVLFIAVNSSWDLSSVVVVTLIKSLSKPRLSSGREESFSPKSMSSSVCGRKQPCQHTCVIKISTFYGMENYRGAVHISRSISEKTFIEIIIYMQASNLHTEIHFHILKLIYS